MKPYKELFYLIEMTGGMQYVRYYKYQPGSHMRQLLPKLCCQAPSAKRVELSNTLNDRSADTKSQAWPLSILNGSVLTHPRPLLAAKQPGKVNLLVLGLRIKC